MLPQIEPRKFTSVTQFSLDEPTGTIRIPEIQLCYLATMRRFTFLLIFGILILACTDFVLREFSSPNKQSNAGNKHADLSIDLSADKANGDSIDLPRSKRQGSEKSAFELINDRIKLKEWNRISELVSLHYSQLSQSQLDELQRHVLFALNKQSVAVRLEVLLSLKSNFPTVEILHATAMAAQATQDWPQALDSLMELSQNQSELQGLAETMTQLKAVSLKLKHQYAQDRDWLSVKSMYEELLLWHPQVSHFQYEYALSLVELDRNQQASQIFESLTYDTEFAESAELMLNRIASKSISDIDGVIEIPLINRGTSSFIAVTINGRAFELLLDTGASITGIANSELAALNLEPSDREIWLNTANGRTRSTLWISSSLKIGPLQVNKLPIAGLNLESNDIQGLLGTDALSAFKDHYSFVINRESNVLEFRPLR